VDKASIRVASLAEVPVWAVEALVTDTVNVLITTVTDSIVTNVATWSKQSLCNDIKVGIFNSRHECMLWVVTMLQAYVARNAKIIVWAGCASNEVLL
jgi:hypothetical protein